MEAKLGGPSQPTALSVMPDGGSTPTASRVAVGDRLTGVVEGVDRGYILYNRMTRIINTVAEDDILPWF